MTTLLEASSFHHHPSSHHSNNKDTNLTDAFFDNFTSIPEHIFAKPQLPMFNLAYLKTQPRLLDHPIFGYLLDLLKTWNTAKEMLFEDSGWRNKLNLYGFIYRELLKTVNEPAERNEQSLTRLYQWYKTNFVPMDRPAPMMKPQERIASGKIRQTYKSHLPCQIDNYYRKQSVFRPQLFNSSLNQKSFISRRSQHFSLNYSPHYQNLNQSHTNSRKTNIKEIKEDLYRQSSIWAESRILATELHRYREEIENNQVSFLINRKLKNLKKSCENHNKGVRHLDSLQLASPQHLTPIASHFHSSNTTLSRLQDSSILFTSSSHTITPTNHSTMHNTFHKQFRSKIHKKLNQLVTRSSLKEPQANRTTQTKGNTKINKSIISKSSTIREDQNLEKKSLHTNVSGLSLMHDPFFLTESAKKQRTKKARA